MAAPEPSPQAAGPFSGLPALVEEFREPDNRRP